MTDQPTTPSLPDRTRRRWTWAGIVVSLPLVFLVYANGLHGPFQYDDRHTIVENPRLRAGVVDAWWWGRTSPELGGGHYRPLTSTSYALNFRVGGLDPFGYHLINVLIHWLATAALMALVWVFTRHPAPVWAAGLLFAVTPANSEAVNYIAARSSLLASTWYAVALLGFVVFRRSQEAWRMRGMLGGMVLALGGVVLGLWSKEIAVTAPLVWAVYDAGWSRRLSWRALVWPYLAGAVLLAGYLMVTDYSAAIWAAVSGGQPGTRGFGENLWTQIAAFPRYLGTFFWPVHLSAFHDVPLVTAPWRPPVIIGAALGAGLVAWGGHWVVRADGDRRTIGLCVIWFVVALLPTMLYPLHVIFQEHRGYLAWMGLAAACGVAAWALANRVSDRRARFALVIGGLGILVLLGAGTIARNIVWSDEVRLWADAAAKAPGHPVPHLNLGAGYARRGEAAPAIASYRRALELAPDYRLAYFNLGTLYYGRGEYDEAREALEAAVRLDPAVPGPVAMLALVYSAQGEAERADAALRAAASALAAAARDDAARLAVADALAKGPRWMEAEPHYRALLAAGGAPTTYTAKAYLGLGFLAERGGSLDRAILAYREAVRVDPHLMDARFNLGNLLVRSGQADEARSVYEAILRDDERFFPARFNLGRLYEQVGRLEDAQVQYRGFLTAAPEAPPYTGARRYAASRLEQMP